MVMSERVRLSSRGLISRSVVTWDTRDKNDVLAGLELPQNKYYLICEVLNRRFIEVNDSITHTERNYTGRNRGRKEGAKNRATQCGW